MIKIALASLAAACICCSCASPTDSPPFETAGPISPTVTGLRITSPDGPQQIAVLGNPSSADQPSSSYSDFVFVNPYPNPTSGDISLSFSNPRTTVVKVWIARAETLGAAGSNTTTVGGAITPVMNMPVVRVLTNALLSAGEFTNGWDGTDSNGRPTPAGYYRVYISRGGSILWHDIFLYRSLNDLPVDLRSLVASW